ncbi:MAG TPA: zinc-binding alcohol dehydrogenase [Erysipelotrichaceae bacterium]|nr:zinc-binding alcohol dehydrogenase [Erysipelotrichaceae bacterium]
MKSYYVELYQKGKARIIQEEISDADLQDNEAIILTDFSMISAGTELSRVFEIKKGFSYPVRPGYCSVGTVLKKGAGIKDFEVNDKVFFNAPHSSVVRWKSTSQTQGPQIYKLDKEINPKYATIINLALVALSGVNSSEVKLLDNVAVFGMGNIGILTALMYQKLGANVIAIDPVENRCQLAQKMGIRNVICKETEGQTEGIMKLTANRGVEIAVDVTGSSEAIITAINSARQYGQVILLGSPRASFPTDITPVFNRMHMKNLKVTGAFNQLAPVKAVEGSFNSVTKNYQTVCDLIKNGDIDVEKLISHTILPEEIETAYHGLMFDKENYNCVILDWKKYQSL